MAWKKPNANCFQIFGKTCYILKDCESLGKFDTKSGKGIFLGYSLNSHAYQVLNKRTGVIQESINIVIDDQPIDPSPIVKIAGDNESIMAQPNDSSPKSEESPCRTELKNAKDHLSS